MAIERSLAPGFATGFAPDNQLILLRMMVQISDCRSAPRICKEACGLHSTS